eukprot:TRINITY_DN19216_c0_g1_i1.p1 TRINITY_DN19216_c0_g1~~TRINITY_DN19216_c0_g1_i1.p1  ORF type:complete len:400 (+),score=79.29 TRINITY_DN19216_c0_g1_i1:87-1286(+)
MEDPVAGSLPTEVPLGKGGAFSWAETGPGPAVRSAPPSAAGERRRGSSLVPGEPAARVRTGSASFVPGDLAPGESPFGAGSSPSERRSSRRTSRDGRKMSAATSAYTMQKQNAVYGRREAEGLADVQREMEHMLAHRRSIVHELAPSALVPFLRSSLVLQARHAPELSGSQPEGSPVHAAVPMWGERQRRRREFARQFRRQVLSSASGRAPLSSGSGEEPSPQSAAATVAARAEELLSPSGSAASPSEARSRLVPVPGRARPPTAGELIRDLGSAHNSQHRSHAGRRTHPAALCRPQHRRPLRQAPQRLSTLAGGLDADPESGAEASPAGSDGKRPQLRQLLAEQVKEHRDRETSHVKYVASLQQLLDREQDLHRQLNRILDSESALGLGALFKNPGDP